MVIWPSAPPQGVFYPVTHLLRNFNPCLSLPTPGTMGKRRGPWRQKSLSLVVKAMHFFSSHGAVPGFTRCN